MLRQFKYFIICCFIFLGLYNVAQETNANSIIDKRIDSLKSELQKLKSPKSIKDSTTLIIRYMIGDLKRIFRTGYWDSLASDAGKIGFYKMQSAALRNKGFILQNTEKIDEALKCHELNKKICEKENLPDQLAMAINSIAFIQQHYKGNIDLAIKLYNQSLEIQQKRGDKNNIGILLNNIGHIYNNQGNIDKALEYFNKALRIFEELKNAAVSAQIIETLGAIYFGQNDYVKAKECIESALKTYKKTGDKNREASALNSLSTILHKEGKTNEAKLLVEQSIDIYQKTNNASNASLAMRNLASIYAAMGRYDSALKLYNKVLMINEVTNHQENLSATYKNMGNLYIKLNNMPKAYQCMNKSLMIARSIGHAEIIRNSAEGLSEVCKLMGKHKEALDNFELYIQMRDSINNESTRKASIKSQLKYEYEKQAAADSVAHAKESDIKNVEIAKQNAEIKAKKNQQYALFGGLGLVIIFAGFMYNRFKITQKQKSIIEEQKVVVEKQKHLVEEKQKEILDSIYYARRIQMAQIPSEKFIIKTLEKLKK